jgi:hypothetical protein
MRTGNLNEISRLQLFLFYYNTANLHQNLNKLFRAYII